MTRADTIIELFNAAPFRGQPEPLGWLAERFLDAVADSTGVSVRTVSNPDGSGWMWSEVEVGGEVLRDEGRALRTLFRPLAACLAVMAADAAGVTPDVYSGSLRFARTATRGPVGVEFLNNHLGRRITAVPLPVGVPVRPAADPAPIPEPAPSAV